MKFCKKYQEYMQGQEQKKLPEVGFKKLKKILKKCRRDSSQSHKPSQTCPDHCSGHLNLLFFSFLFLNFYFFFLVELNH